MKVQKITVASQTFDGTSPGTSYAVIGRASYDVEGNSVLVASLNTDTPTGTTPTLDVKIQHSVDKVNWHDLVAFTQLTTVAGAEVKIVPGPGTSDAKAFARYVRFMAKVGGTSPSYPVGLVMLELHPA